jgi:hypothetical protein
VLPDGVLYTSKETHYSVFKAARMYRMDIVKINTLVTGELDLAEFRCACGTRWRISRGAFFGNGAMSQRTRLRVTARQRSAVQMHPLFPFGLHVGEIYVLSFVGK